MNLENFENGVNLFLQEGVAELVGSVSTVESNAVSAVELPVNLVKSLLNDGNIVTSLGEELKDLYTKGSNANVEGVKSVLL